MTFNLILKKNRLKRKPHYKILILNKKNNQLIDKIGHYKILPHNNNTLIALNVKKFLYWSNLGLKYNPFIFELTNLIIKHKKV